MRCARSTCLCVAPSNFKGADWMRGHSPWILQETWRNVTYVVKRTEMYIITLLSASKNLERRRDNGNAVEPLTQLKRLIWFLAFLSLLRAARTYSGFETNADISAPLAQHIFWVQSFANGQHKVAFDEFKAAICTAMLCPLNSRVFCFHTYLLFRFFLFFVLAFSGHNSAATFLQHYYNHYIPPKGFYNSAVLPVRYFSPRLHTGCLFIRDAEHFTNTAIRANRIISLQSFRYGCYFWCSSCLQPK